MFAVSRFHICGQIWRKLMDSPTQVRSRVARISSFFVGIKSSWFMAGAKLITHLGRKRNKAIIDGLRVTDSETIQVKSGT